MNVIGFPLIAVSFALACVGLWLAVRRREGRARFLVLCALMVGCGLWAASGVDARSWSRDEVLAVVDDVAEAWGRERAAASAASGQGVPDRPDDSHFMLTLRETADEQGEGPADELTLKSPREDVYDIATRSGEHRFCVRLAPRERFSAEVTEGRCPAA
ncbi:hypothetical protein [Streptomyces sp. TRM64462]|uniref:hypothetical protein n=1 Tax=Streptomyces sp. TRM64462 TaxID=2741726 RepID=UPI0015868445|nr:hypothetical protein [Streptomyces sp. TRM64462]